MIYPMSLVGKHKGVGYSLDAGGQRRRSLIRAQGCFVTRRGNGCRRGEGRVNRESTGNRVTISSALVHSSNTMASIFTVRRQQCPSLTHNSDLPGGDVLSAPRPA